MEVELLVTKRDDDDDRPTDDRVNIGQPAPGKLNCRVLQFFNWIETGRDNLLDAPGGVIE